MKLNATRSQQEIKNVQQHEIENCYITKVIVLHISFAERSWENYQKAFNYKQITDCYKINKASSSNIF